MTNLKQSLNEYLFHEFGVEGDESSISETWPFRLREVGQVGDTTVFEFAEGEPFFALAGSSMGFLPASGMTVEDLSIQFAGSKWIGERDPISLEESRPGEPAVPSGIERRDALEKLGNSALGLGTVEILEGLFLRDTQSYAGLFRSPGEPDAVVAGLGDLIRVAFPTASPWRRLAWGVGHWLRDRAEGG